MPLHSEPGGTGALPNRTPFPLDKDALDGTALLRYTPTTREQEVDASAFVASRARALGWTRDRHEAVIAALFAPARPLMPHHKRNAIATNADQEQP